LRLDPIERLNLGICTGAVATSLALSSSRFAASLALGAAIEAINFRALRSASLRLLAGDLSVGRAWILVFALRFFLLAAVLAVAFRAGAHPVGLLLGLSMIVPAAILGAWRQRPAVGNPAPGPPPDDPSWDRWNPWLARERAPEEEEDE
jgi:hypothetical protein